VIIVGFEDHAVRQGKQSVAVRQIFHSEHRFSIDLAPYRLLLDQQLKTLSVINPSGSIDILGAARTEGVGETIKVRILARFQESHSS
jgi:hypothetical protein